MSPPASHPPLPIMRVLDTAIDAVLGGSHGWLHVPRNGYLNVTWLPRKECYRVTIDVTAGHPLTDAAEAFNCATRQRIEAAL